MIGSLVFQFCELRFGSWFTCDRLAHTSEIRQTDNQSSVPVQCPQSPWSLMSSHPQLILKPICRSKAMALPFQVFGQLKFSESVILSLA